MATSMEFFPIKTSCKWPHREKVAEFLKGKQADDGTVSLGDSYDAKKFTSSTFYDMDAVTYGSVATTRPLSSF